VRERIDEIANLAPGHEDQAQPFIPRAPERVERGIVDVPFAGDRAVVIRRKRAESHQVCRRCHYTPGGR